jgi:hypothetical protein
MTDHGKEESEGEEASGRQGKARSREEERRQEKSPSVKKEGEQSEGSQESEEGQEGSAEESTGEVREGCIAAQGRVGSEESDGATEARCSGRTAAHAGAGSRAGERPRSRAAAAVDEYGSFRLSSDR